MLLRIFGLAVILLSSFAAAAPSALAQNATSKDIASTLDQTTAEIPGLEYMYGQTNATTPEAPALTLAQAVGKALADNPQIASAQTIIKAAQHGIHSAQGGFYPKASGGYKYTLYNQVAPLAGRSDHQFQLFFNVKQNIFTGWNLDETLGKAKLQYEQAQANLSDTELSLILSVQENFLNMLAAREDLRSARDAVTRLESQLQVTQAFYDVGLKPRLDVLQAETDLAGAEDGLLKAQNAVATQQARLNTLLAMPIEAEVAYVGELAYAPLPLELPTALEKAYKNRPDMWLASLAVDIARKDAGVARSALFPQVSADFSWYRQGEDPDVNGGSYNETDFTGWDASITGSYELFDGGESRNAWKQAQESAASLAQDLRNLRLEVAFDVKSKILDIEEAAKRIKVARVGVASAKEGYRMAVARYQAQVGTNTDVLDAQARLTTAEANLTSALADYQIALARFYVAIGERNQALAVQ